MHNERPFEMSKCPHPHYGHQGSRDEKAAYLVSDEWRQNDTRQKQEPLFPTGDNSFK